ncbi:NAD-dependent epimerase [Mangrovimonas yunxiaonensis]|uniref:NAD-dependent epimerase n=1 Tax=Mangrovimonas yunxiaonensis TaxID=1197477 RepID=A0A084TLG8_9FLAO|nr:NAD-dependent epimerase/dehydratase family protein [Mangrovimonas yunxiaonensis]KFB01554.1 NAD-dependent epimerase [Mangrovimonas yunxiaonensis]GGH35991.1 NAD-dependent epimerase [Mangrovimonas yunxiaonensis]
MILVTGGTGLVGSHLLVSLTGKHEKVRAIYRNKATLAAVKNVFGYFNAQERFNRIEWVEAHLLNLPMLTEAFEGISHVYHCAALVSFNPDKYHDLRKSNIEGTANIVNLCIANGIKKLCYVSSIATLSASTTPNKAITETSYWNPEASNSVYSITKYGAEMEVWRGTQEGVPAIIVNPGVILGSGFWANGSGYIFTKIAQGTPFYTKGSTGYVDVMDVVHIMVKLMASDQENQNYVLVAENWAYPDFLTTVAQALHVSPPKKQASKLLLNIAWRLDWLRAKLTKKDRQFTKHLAKTLNTKSTYDSTKIKTTLDYTFTPLEQSINTIAARFLNEH